MRYPGEVWYLPADARENGDPKMRRHVLLTGCRDEDDCGTLAYASTQGTEASFGAAALLLDPSASHYGRGGGTGFDRPTYIYPSRLVAAGGRDLRRQMGRIIDEMADLRGKLQVALGLGTGTALGVRGAGGSWRGRVVRLCPDLASESDCELALVVTQPAYSNRQRYQIFVPILDADEFEAAEGDVQVPGPAWLPEAAGTRVTAVILAVPLVQTAFHPTEIDRWTGGVVSEGTMDEVDESLRHVFGL